MFEEKRKYIRRGAGWQRWPDKFAENGNEYNNIQTSLHTRTHTYTRTHAHTHTHACKRHKHSITHEYPSPFISYCKYSLLFCIGIYPYMCNLHKGMGMRGYITVVSPKDRINRTPGRIIWGILGGAFLLGFGVLIVYLIVRAIVTPTDDD